MAQGLALVERLILFTRYPEPGAVKTRLIPALGAQGAAETHRALTEHALEAMRTAAATREGVQLVVSFAGGDEAAMRDWLGGGVTYARQDAGGSAQGADLGKRMRAAFDDAFGRGVQRAVLLGSDAPGITPPLLHQALNLLDPVDVVLGPAEDGGYTCIGLAAPHHRLFDGPAWGTDTVLADTLRRADRLGLRVALLPPLADVDAAEDLAAWEAVQAREPGPEPRVSVVIPALNEEDHIAGTVRCAVSGGNVEVLVVDGGSTDATAARANAASATVFVRSANRGARMNAGAAAATGGLLLFLHADTLLPENWANVIRETLVDPEVVLGAFELGLDRDTRGMRLVARRANARSRGRGLPYGDQGLFVRRDTYDEAGGFREWPLLDDYEFVTRLRERGRVVTVPHKVMTSCRRWARRGVVFTTLINQAILFAYRLGVPPATLARIYRSL